MAAGIGPGYPGVTTQGMALRSGAVLPDTHVQLHDGTLMVRAVYERTLTALSDLHKNSVTRMCVYDLVYRAVDPRYDLTDIFSSEGRSSYAVLRASHLIYNDGSITTEALAVIQKLGLAVESYCLTPGWQVLAQ